MLLPDRGPPGPLMLFFLLLSPARGERLGEGVAENLRGPLT